MVYTLLDAKSVITVTRIYNFFYVLADDNADTFASYKNIKHLDTI